MLEVWKHALSRQFGLSVDGPAEERAGFGKDEADFAELLLYMRHRRQHAGELNPMLRQTTDSAPGWVAQVKSAWT